MNVHPPDKSLFEEAALEIGIGEPFIEKDWFVTHAISILAQIQSDDYEIIFSRGTALSKAHGLLKRFSEDIDFRVLSKKNSRKALSNFKNNVFEHLRQNGFQFDDHQTKARDGNRYFLIDLEYKTQFQRPKALRAHLQIEFSVRDIQLPALYLPIQSFVSELRGHKPEVAIIGCIDPVESASDKLSALAWRIPDRRRGDTYDDPAIVRHIHDLAVLEKVALNNQTFPQLVLASMIHDDRRSKNNQNFTGLPIIEKFEQMFEILNSDKEYKNEYERFVKGVSYAAEKDIPSYDEALKAVRLMADVVVSSK